MSRASLRGTVGREPAVLGVLLIAAFLLPIVAGKPAPGGVYVLGTVAAGILALHAVGIVLTARADRCLNLAQLQTGVLAGTLFAVGVQGRPLIRGGQALCRSQCLSDPGSGLLALQWVVMAVLAIGVAAGIGRLVSAVVVRRLRSTSPVVVTVATAFVTQFLVGVTDRVDKVLSTEEQRTRGDLGGAVTPPVDVTFRIGGANLNLSAILIVVLGFSVVIGLTIWLRRTNAGRDLRAAATDPDRAATLGIDPTRVSGRAWALAGALAGVAGVLTAAIGGLGALGDGGLSTSLLVRVLAVAVTARLTSLPLAGAAALAIGLLDAAGTWVAGTTRPLDGALVVIVGVVLLLQRSSRKGGDRGETGEAWAAVRSPRPVPSMLARLPEVIRAKRVLIGLGLVLALGLPFVLSPAQTGLAAVAATTALVALSTLVVTGWAGQVSLGQLAFAAVGAFVAGATHLPMPLAVVLGAAVAAGAAALVGIPSLRLRGLEPAAVTLALALAATAVLLDPTGIGKIVGDVGGDGLPFVDLRDPRTGWYVAVAVAAAAAVVVGRFRDSRLGRALVAARDDVASASSFGIDVARARLVGFAAAGALAGAGGALLAHLQGSVAVESFTPEVGLTVFTVTVLGGLGTTAGPILGVAVAGVLTVTAVPTGIASLLTGLGGLILLLSAPGGLVQVAIAGRDAYLRRVARRRRLEVAGLTEGVVDGVAPIAPASPTGDLVGAGTGYRLSGQWGLPGGEHG